MSEQSMSRSLELPQMGNLGEQSLYTIPTLDECDLGGHPTEYNVVIAPAMMNEKVGSIILAYSTKERSEDAGQIGRIVAVSPLAFNFAEWPLNAGPPQVGDIVLFARYAGGQVAGRDGRIYRVIKDKDITMKIED